MKTCCGRSRRPVCMSEQARRWRLGRAAFEALESRTMLTTPAVTGFIPAGHSNDPYQDLALTFSEPLTGEDARAAGTYTVKHFGADRIAGGTDDRFVPFSPAYVDGTNQVTLTSAVDLGAWQERDYFMNLGLLGDWQAGNAGGTVRQLADGGATFYVSGASLIDQPFAGRIALDAAATDGDFVGLVFGFAPDAASGRPDQYYLLSWKGAAQGTAEAGIKLVKVIGSGESGQTPDLWDLESGDPRLTVLAAEPGATWAAGSAYDFVVDYRSDGTIDIGITRSADAATVWSFSMVDPAPLGAGQVGFYNLSQAGVTYSATAGGPVALADGVYELRAASGTPGLRGLDGTALDGDNDGAPGGDYVKQFVIDTTAPVISGVVPAKNALYATFVDDGGMDAASVQALANYQLFSSGGDGTFSDGNEVNLSSLIAGVTWDGAMKVATIALAELPSAADRYEMRISGVADLAGNALAQPVVTSFGGSDVLTDANVWKISGPGAWSAAGNWSLGHVPVTGEMAVIGHPAAAPTVSANATLGALSSIGTLKIAAGTFKLTGVSIVGGTLQIGEGAVLAASGAGASVLVNGDVSMAGGQLLAENGGTLTLSTLASYSGGTTNGDRYLRASGAGSVLNLPALASLASNANGYTTYIDAYGGGVVNVPLLSASGNNSVYFIADGASSAVNLPALASLSGRDGGRSSYIEARNGGAIDTPLLATLSNVYWKWNANAAADTAQVTSLTGGRLDVTGGAPDFALLANIDASSIYMSGGGMLTLPLIAGYFAGAQGGDTALRATGAGSLLALPSLTTLTSNANGYTTYIDAYAAGTVRVPGVASVSNNSVYFIAEGAGSRVDASGLTSLTGRNGGRQSLIEPRLGGSVDLGTTGLTLTNAVMTVAEPSPWTMGLVDLQAGAILRGSGTLAADVTSIGEVRPGTSAGRLAIEGNYTQLAAGSLTIELGGAAMGTGYDQLAVSGTASLAGTLRVSAISSYVPAFGYEHAVLSAGSISGDFGTWQGLDLGSNRVLAVSRTAGQIGLIARFGGGTGIDQDAAARTTVPAIPGDGTFIELFNGIGGGTTPLPSSLVGVSPSGTTLSPFIDFPRPGSVINVGSSFNTFFASTALPPEQVSGLSAKNFTLRATYYLAVDRAADLDPTTTPIDLRLGLGSDDGFHLTVGGQVLGSASDRPFTYSWMGVSFEGPGLYPVSLLFAANAVGSSGLEMSWETIGGTAIIPQSAMYISPAVGDRFISFEEYPAGTDVSDQYRAEGIVFARQGGDLQITDARPTDFVPVSTDRVYADPAATGAPLGQVEWTFVVPGTAQPAATDFVGFYLIDAEAIGATVTAYDAEGAVLFAGEYHAGGRTQELVTIQRPRIARVVVTLGEGADTVAIDNVSYSTPVALNRRPAIQPIADAAIDELSALAFTAVGSDPDQPEQTISYSLDAGAPAGATVDPVTGAFAWTPTEAQGPGEYAITVRVTDNAALPLSAAETFTVTVREVNAAPSIQPIPAQYASTAEALVVQASGSDTDVPAQALTYSLDPGAPADATINPQTGRFSWAPTLAVPEGAYPVTIRVSDPGGLSATALFNITVDHTPPGVTGMVPSGVVTALQQIEVSFSEAIRASSVTAADFALVGPGGNVPVGSAVQIDADTWRVTFASQSIAGRYTLTAGPGIQDLAGNAMAAPFVGSAILDDQKAPFVTLASPLGAVSQAVGSISVQFSEEIDAATFTPADVSVVGPGGAVDPGTMVISRVSATTWTIGFPAQSQEGSYQFTIGPDIRDLVGNTLAGAYSGLFTIDRTGPRITGMAPSGDLHAPVGSVTLTFDSPILASSFSAADVTLVGPAGLVATTPTRLSETVYRISFATQRGNGTYNLTVGPDVTDMAGNPMEVFHGSFALALPDLDADPGPTPLPGTVNHGIAFGVDWIVRNVGMWAPAAAWTDSVYLSVNGEWDSGDRLLTSKPGGPLAAGASYTASATVTIPEDVTIAEGTYHILVKTDSADLVGESAETNNVVSLGTLSLTFPQLPDLVVGGITAPPSVEAGATAQVSWIVANTQATAAVGNWTIDLYLSSDNAVGQDQLLRTLSYSGTIPGLGQVEQSEAITVPALGVGGDQWVVAKVTAGEGIFERDPYNNTAIDDLPMHVPVHLTLDISAASIAENAASPIIRGTVTRSGSAASELVVSLASSDLTELVVPPSVIIPAGHYAAAFNITAQDDGVLDGNQLVTISASASGTTPAERQITVLDAQVPSLALFIDAMKVTEGGTVNAEVTRDLVTDQPLLVSLTTSRSGQLSLPATITIPANAASAAFIITGIDDAVPEKDQTLTVSALASGYQTGARDLLVIDNDLPTLELTLANASISEGAGTSATIGTVRRIGNTGAALLVRLTSSDTTEAAVPQHVTIPAGLDYVEFQVAAVDDALVDGPQAVTISAVGILPDCGCQTPNPTGTATADLVVLDDDGPTLSVSIDRELVAEGTHGAAVLTVSRNTSTASDLLVLLVSSDTDELTVPASVVIPAGRSQSDPVPLTSIADGVPDGNKTVLVTAMASGFTQGFDQIIVTDSDQPDLVVGSVSAEARVLADRYFNVTYRVDNAGFAEAVSTNATPTEEGTWIDRVYLSADPFVGEDIPLGSYTFTGTVPAGLGYERTVPIMAPTQVGDYWVIVVTDLGNTVPEILESNNARVSAQPVRVAPAYVATVYTDVEVAVAGTTAAPTIVPLSGQATMTDTGAPAPLGTLVNIHITVSGTRRVISALTDATGSFSVNFKLLPGEGGRYGIGAAHPGESAAPVQDEFLVLGMKAEPEPPTQKVVEGTPTGMNVGIRNLADVALTGLTATVISKPANLNVTLNAPSSLPASGLVQVGVQMTAMDASVTSGTVMLRIGSNEGATLEVAVPVTIEALRPVLDADVERLVAAMLIGEQRAVSFRVTNAGSAPTGPMTVDLPQADWLSLASGAAIASLAPGESTTVTLLLTPMAGLPLIAFDGSVALVGDAGTLLSMPFTFRHVSQATGSLQVMAVDELFYFTAEAPRLAGATVRLIDPFTGEERFTGTTDAIGIVVAGPIAEGYYELVVEADKHETFRENIFVTAGQTTEQTAFLSRQTIQYIWKVEPTEIEDRTRIVIESVFETNVPVPVVTVDPAVIDLAPLQLIGQTMQVDMTITNHGLINAEGVALNFGTHPFYEIKPLIRDIGILPAKSSLTIPVVITRTGDFTKGIEPADAKSVSCGIIAEVIWAYLCGPALVGKGTPIAITGVEGNCTAGPGGVIWPIGGGGGGGLVPRGVVTATNCDECGLERLKKLVDCLIGFIPGVGCPKSIYDCYTSVTDGGVTGEDAAKCLWGALNCLADLGWPGKVIDGLICVYDIVHACDNLPGGGGQSGKGTILPLDATGTMGGAVAVLEQRGQWLADSIEWMYTLFGDPAWITSASGPLLMDFVAAFQSASAETSELGLSVSDAERATLVSMPSPEGVDVTKVNVFIDRWNRTLDYYDQGIFTVADVPAGQSADFVPWDQWGASAAQANTAILAAEAAGFPSPSEAVMQARQDLYDILIDSSQSGGVCATVKLQIEQEAVMTRTAFNATLDLVNNTAAPLENVSVNLRVLDGSGLDVTHLFGIRPPELTNLGAVDGTGTVVGGTTGSARWTIIPSLDAAPDGPTVYYVTGTLEYDEDGLAVVVDLVPTPITVHPQAELHLDYFHQRDVIGDDPFTDPVEPSQPYVLGVIVNNVGRGEAQDLTITSAQPKIIENEKGLLIDFKIIATQVEDDYLVPSLTASFGDFAPGEVQVGQWLLTSTLQGQFIDYSATFEHLDGLGDPRLSIIQSVEIHELIRAVQAGGSFADGIVDFLANDLPDLHDLPDTLYLSDGSVHEVSLAENIADNGPLSGTRRTVSLTADVQEGWTYIKTPDPGVGDFRLVRVMRTDGTNLPAANFWQTDRTFIEGGRQPILENNLHLLDYNSTGAYILFYESIDQAGPFVQSIEQPGPGYLTEPVESLTVTFSEDLALLSFGREDLVLTRDGGDNLIDNGVSVVRLDAKTYRVEGLAGLTGAGGFYEFFVDTTGVRDTFGNAGAGTASVGWIKLPDVPIVLSIDGLGAEFRQAPVGQLDVTFSEPINLSTFTASDLILSRDGQAVGIDPALSIAQVSEATYRLGSLAAVTAQPGHYVLKVLAGGVEDLEGNLGQSFGSIEWTVDLTAPQVDHLAGPPDVTRASVDAIDIYFTEEIDPATLGVADMSLTRGGGENLLGSGLILQRLTPYTHWRLSGLSSLTALDGQYEFCIDAAGVTDLAGNPGIGGTTCIQWLKDSVAPTAPSGLFITPDTGISSSDGRTNTPTVTISGTIHDGDVIVLLRDMTTGQDLGEATLTGMRFDRQATFATGGLHRVRARALDPAGNSADSFFDVFIDLTPPSIVSFPGAPTGLWWDPVPTVDLAFSEAIDPATLGLEDVTLLLGGTPMSLEGVTLEPVDASGLTFRLDNLPAAAPGTYELRVNLAQVLDIAGRAGVGTASTTWIIRPEDSVPPTIEAVTIPSDSPARSQVDSIAVRFSEPMQAPAMIEDGSILAAFTLVRVAPGGPAAVTLLASQFSYDDATDTLLWSADAGVLAEGRYELRLAESMFRDLRGNPVSAAPPVEFALGQVLQAGGMDLAVAAYSVPSLVDWNNDGRLDLVVGEKAAEGGKVRVYLNSGTAAAPVYNAFVYAQGPAGAMVVPAGGCQGAAPRVVDWDGDGKKDLLVGLSDGTVRFYTNIGADGAPTFNAGAFVQVGLPGVKATIDVGDRALIEVVDWNEDGRTDLLVGGLDGKIRLYINQNAGAGMPDFRTTAFLQADGAELVILAGRAAPTVADLDGDGRKDLVVGDTAGLLHYFANVGSNAAPVLTRAGLIQSGGQVIDLAGDARSRPFAADYNADGRVDLLVGAADGRVRLYAGEASAGIDTTTFHALELTWDAVVNEGEAADLAISAGGDTLAFTWDFDDGSAPGSGMSTSHAFAEPGTYFVTTTAVDVDGAAIVETLRVAVLPSQRSGTEGDDTLMLRVDDAREYAEFYENRTLAQGPTYILPVGVLQNLTYDGSGGDDTLIVDLHNGNPLPMVQLDFAGGAGDNRAVLTGDGMRTGAIALRAAGGADMIHVGTPAIRFSGAGGIRAEGFGRLDIASGGGADAMSIASPDGIATALSGTTAGAAITPVALVDVDELRLDLSAGDTALGAPDTLAISGALPGDAPWVRVTGGGGTDQVSITGSAVRLSATGQAMGILATDAAVDLEGNHDLASLSLQGNSLMRMSATVKQLLSTRMIQVGSDAALDLGRCDLFMPSSAPLTALAAIRAMVERGRTSGAGGPWTGTGIRSRVAAGDVLEDLKVTANDWGDGTPLVESLPQGVIVKQTLRGDLDINEVVDGDDLFQMDYEYLTGEPAGPLGTDLDYNGRFDGDDYYLADSSFLSQAATKAVGFSTAAIRPAAMPAVAAADPLELASELDVLEQVMKDQR